VVHHELVICRMLPVRLRLPLTSARCCSHAYLWVMTKLIECRYRRLRTFFSLTQHWQEYDPFFESKAETYKSSSGAIVRTFST
jgi:hypothetical protein